MADYLANMSSTIVTDNADQSSHKLHSGWALWAHLPHDTDWSIKSYKLISKFATVEDAIILLETIPDKMISNCMLFIMRDKINPTWEDLNNRKGGSFSYKVSNKTVCDIWKKLSYALVGETLATDNKVLSTINGITISPKKNFCIVKIWMSTCNYQNPAVIKKIIDITPNGCLFKKHSPEY